MLHHTYHICIQIYIYIKCHILIHCPKVILWISNLHILKNAEIEDNAATNVFNWPWAVPTRPLQAWRCVLQSASGPFSISKGNVEAMIISYTSIFTVHGLEDRWCILNLNLWLSWTCVELQLQGKKWFTWHRLTDLHFHGVLKWDEFRMNLERAGLEFTIA